jgi:PAS domain S-box-containing protein
METTSRIRILMVEESRDEVGLVREMLGDCRKFTWDLDWAADYDSALGQVARGAYDILLVDSRIGGRSGMDFLKEKVVVDCRAAIVVFSARGDYDTDLAAMAAGAMDYLVKGQFDSVMLERSIRYAVSLKRSRDELVRAGESLERTVRLRTLELVQAKEDAEASLAKLNALFDSLEEGIVIFGKDLSIQRINPAGYRILGLTLEQLHGHPGDLGRALDLRDAKGFAPPIEELPFSRALKGESVFQEEWSFTRKIHGSRVRLLVSAAPFPGPGGTIAGAVVSMRDITAQKRMEQRQERLHKRVEKERSLLQAILGQMPIGVVIVDAAGRMILANRQAEAIAGFPFSGEGQERFRERCALPGGVRLEREQWPLFRSLRDGQLVTNLELVLEREDGTSATLSVSSAPVRETRGKNMAGVLMITDITRRKQSEAELLSIRADLEERVRKRTLELEGASRAKDEFLANMSHEIRTPMSGVLGMTEILLQRDLPEEIRSDLSIIRESTGSVLTLLNDLLDLSRIEQGCVELHPSDFDLYGIIDGLVRPFELQAMEKGLTFGVFLDQDLPVRVHGDPDRLGQVVKNLLSNAVKFTEEGGVRLRIRNQTGANNGNGVKLLFSVADTGAGIAKTKHKLLFQPFSQLDPSLSRRHGGSGLGLAITRKLVRLMGGDIDVESRKGGGATFSFTVTLRSARENGEAVASVPLCLSDLRPLSFLLAEDNAVNRLFLNRALRRAGHSVIEAENGKEALEKLASVRVDCVLMDVQMPVMDGMQATRKIRRSRLGPIDPTIPIVAMTAYAMKGDREKCLNAGMDGYVSKPVDFSELARTILQVTQGRGGHEPAQIASC